MYEAMWNWYKATTAADSYVVGFTYKHALYLVEVSELSDAWVKADRASSKKGGWRKLRVKLTTAAKRELVETGAAELVGGEELLTADPLHNKGENFERVVTERAGQTWVKDSVPFWVAGDLRVNGLEVQVKLDGAELTNERCYTRMALA